MKINIGHCINRTHIVSIETMKTFDVEWRRRRCAWVGERLHMHIKTNAPLPPGPYVGPYFGQALRQCHLNTTMASPGV